MGTGAGTAIPGGERLAANRAWVRCGVAAAATGMLAWVVGVALIPLDAKLGKSEQDLAQVLRAHASQLDAAALLAVAGAVLLVVFVAVLTCLVPEGYPGWALLRVSLAGCVITQTVVAIGACFALAAVHTGAGLVVGWRALWLTFQASAVPTVLFTVTAVLGLRRAGLSPPLVSALGWLSAAAHLLVLFTLAQRGRFAPDWIIAALVPLTTVIWMLGPNRRTARFAAGSGCYRRSLLVTRSQGKKTHDRRSDPVSPERKSIMERFTPVLVDWWKARPPKLIEELTFRNVAEYFVSQHPGDPSVQSGALLRMPHPRGHNMFQVFLGPSNELWLDREGQPYGRQFIAMRLDSELRARLQDTDMILFR